MSGGCVGHRGDNTPAAEANSNIANIDQITWFPPIASVTAVKVKWPKPDRSVAASADGWSHSTYRATPMTRHQDLQQKSSSAASAMHADEVWVQITAKDGTFGLGRTAFGSPVAEYVRGVVAPLLGGQDPTAIELHNDVLWRASLRVGAEGHSSMARSAVDLALWDLKGKLLGLPVFSLLGGPLRKSVRCYATTDDLEWAAELGFKSFKISNDTHHDAGTQGLRHIESRVADARERVGRHADLMFNPIMPFNLEFTVRLAETLRPYGLAWLEEPLQPWDFEGHRLLRERAPFMPIATGEDHHGRHSFASLINRRAADVLQPDIEWCGGLSEAVKIHTLAEAAGIEVVPHAGANTPWGQHFGIAMSGASLAEYWLGSDPGVALLAVDRIPGTAHPEDGLVTPNSAPGFGLEIDESQIRPWF